MQIRDNKREGERKWDGAEKKSADNLFYDAALEETDTHIHTHIIWTDNKAYCMLVEEEKTNSTLAESCV